MNLVSRLATVAHLKVTRIFSAGVVGVVTCLTMLWWYWAPRRAARDTCERFIALPLADRCAEAYELTVRTTYKFSTIQSFCEEEHSHFAHNWQDGIVSCFGGEWHGVNYVVFGDLRRSKDAPPLSFGMTMSRETGSWLVQNFTFDD